MTATRPQRLAMALYPARFRSRYGDEMLAATEAAGAGFDVSLDLLRSAASAWLRPSFPGDEAAQRAARFGATASTVFVAWCGAFLCAAAFAKGVDDRPLPGLHAWGAGAYHASMTTVAICAAVVMAGGLAYWIPVVVSAWRARRRAVVMLAVLPAPIVAVWGGLTLLMSWYAKSYTGLGGHLARSPGALALALLALYGLATLAAVAGCAASVVTALSRSSLPERRLRPAVVVAGLVAAALAVEAAASSVALARVLLVGGIDVRDMVLAVTPVAGMLVAMAVAVTSAARGVRALRAA